MVAQQDLGQILPASSREWPWLAFDNDPSIIAPHLRRCTTLGAEEPTCALKWEGKYPPVFKHFIKAEDHLALLEILF